MVVETEQRSDGPEGQSGRHEQRRVRRSRRHAEGAAPSARPRSILRRASPREQCDHPAPEMSAGAEINVPARRKKNGVRSAKAMARSRSTTTRSWRKTPATTSPATYAGSTASLPAAVASAPEGEEHHEEELDFWLAHPVADPFDQASAVRRGRTNKVATVTAAKTASSHPNWANRPPRASTVPRSVTKHAARMSLPMSWRLRPVSTMTA